MDSLEAAMAKESADLGGTNGSAAIDDHALAVAKPRRQRSKERLRFAWWEPVSRRRWTG